MKRLVILLLAVSAPFAVAEPYENLDTWCGGGADGLTSTDENWESGSAPDITSNDLLAIFATGGSEALLPAGTAAAFAGIVLDGANLGGNRFEFTAGSGATATIGECALTVSNAPSAITWSIRWPITLKDFPQTWTIGRNNTVEFNERIDGEQDLVFAGSGTAKLNADSTRSGLLKVTSGTLWLAGSWKNCTNVVVAGGTFAVKNENAFGDEGRAPGKAPKVKVQVEAASGAKLALDYFWEVIDCAEFRVDGERLYGTFGAPGSGADHEFAWISGRGLMRTWGYADWAAANGVSGAWDATDADGVANVFRYAFDKPTGAFANPPLLDIAIEDGAAVVKTPPVVNTAGFAISVVESGGIAGAAVARRRSPDAAGRAVFAMENAPSRFYRLSATEKREHVGVRLWENGPYWATTNVGADEPWESGYYFWWGDTAGCTHDGSKWISVEDGAEISFTNSLPANSTYRKSVSALRSSGYIDTTNNLVATHDAAHVHWGGEWRMPTSAELSDLVGNCTATWITTNGVSGYLVTGTGEYADRSIFLPAAGYGGGSQLNGPGSQGQYWSSSPLPSNTMGSFYLYLNSGGFGRGNYIRYYGQSVRPVRNAD